MIEPRFTPPTTAYLRESAAQGRLELVRITSVTSLGGEWIYTYSTQLAGPQAPGLYGDRRSQVHTSVLYLTESELVTQCEAIDLAEAAAQAALNQVIRLRHSAGCPEG